MVSVSREMEIFRIKNIKRFIDRINVNINTGYVLIESHNSSYQKKNRVLQIKIRTSISSLNKRLVKDFDLFIFTMASISINVEHVDIRF